MGLAEGQFANVTKNSFTQSEMVMNSGMPPTQLDLATLIKTKNAKAVGLNLNLTNAVDHIRIDTLITIISMRNTTTAAEQRSLKPLETKSAVTLIVKLSV